MQDYSTTAFLLKQYQQGDKTSCEELFQLYHPALMRWAHGRIPNQAKSFMETQDIVQDTMISAFKRINHIQAKRPGAFFSYLRTVFINQIKQELRKNKPFQLSITQFSNDEKMAYEKDINTIVDYDNALDKIADDEKEAIILRLEFGFNYAEIAK
ncbi:MAG TPA: sigma-70 family RNA polymerase sigma factor, partial [Oceanospirillales bacterium]|nr:sigma-70 family RNA polymerase sigma factor [Oceanospirillales bacterium]